MRRIVIVLGILLDIVVALALYPREFLNIGQALLFGWVGFVRRIVPQIEVNWTGVATGLVFVGLLVALLHLFARWCYHAAAESSSPARCWRFRWTLSMVLALMLLFAAGYSTIGLARQVGWMCSSQAPLFDAKEIRHGKVRD